MSTLLLIGGTGFFGKSILDGFQRGLLQPWGIETIHIMARQTEEFKVKHVNLINDRVKFHTLDIAKCNSLPKAEYVIHAAASTNAVNYLIQPEEEKINIQAGTYNYCKLALEYHQHSKIIFCSSGAVYGQQPEGVEFISENFALEPIATLAENKKDYAAAKRDAENAFIDLGRAGLQVSIARCFAFVGAFLPRDQHFAIGNFIEDGLRNRPIIVKANCPVFRSYMHADDLVNWLMTICHSASSLCPIYNVGSSNALAIGDLAELVAKRFNIDVHKEKFSQEGVDRYIPSIDKAKKELGLKLEIDLPTAIEKTIDAVLSMNNRHA